MTALAAAPDRTWDPVRFQRGTRGFAAFLTIINGLAVLAFGAVVAPLSGIGSPLDAWLAIAGIAAGIAHLVAVYGLIRGREWGGTLVAYLAAAGIGASVFAVLLIARAGESVLGAADASAIGYFIWMIGSWLVAARFAFMAFRAPTVVARPTVVALPTPRVVAPVTTHRRVVASPPRQPDRVPVVAITPVPFSRLRHPARSRGDLRRMSWRIATGHALVMDTLSLLVLAIGSLAFLDLAAANLRGNDRSSRRARR